MWDILCVAAFGIIAVVFLILEGLEYSLPKDQRDNQKIHRYDWKICVSFIMLCLITNECGIFLVGAIGYLCKYMFTNSPPRSEELKKRDQEYFEKYYPVMKDKNKK